MRVCSIGGPTPNSLVKFPSPTLSVLWLNMINLSLHRDRHINNLVRVLNLRESHLVDLLDDSG